MIPAVERSALRADLPPPILVLAELLAEGTFGASASDALRDALRQGAAFVGLTRQQTILGQLAGTVPAPPHLNVPIALNDSTAGWVAQGKPMPAAVLNLDLVTMGLTKLAMIVGVSRDFLKSTDDKAISLLERHLRQAAISGENAALLSDDAAISGERPAGLLFGLSSIGGGSPLSLMDDLTELWAAVRGGDPSAPYFVVSPRGAMFLWGLKQDGVPLFPNVSPRGGSIAGVPQLVSKAASNRLILVDAAALAVTDLGVLLDQAENATVQMDDAPTEASSMVLVSGFQQDVAFLKIIRLVFWQLAHPDGAAFVQLPIAA